MEERTALWSELWGYIRMVGGEWAVKGRRTYRETDKHIFRHDSGGKKTNSRGLV